MLLHGYILLFFSFIAGTIVLYLPIAFFLKKKKSMGFLRQSSFLLLFLSLFVIIFGTIILFQLPISFRPERHILNLQPLKWIGEGEVWQRVVAEIRPNILIFVPLGLFLPMAYPTMRKWYRTALAALSVTFCIEFFQYFIGRSSDIDDVIANLLGGMLGYGTFKSLSYVCKNKLWWNKMAGM